MLRVLMLVLLFSIISFPAYASTPHTTNRAKAEDEAEVTKILNSGYVQASLKALKTVQPNTTSDLLISFAVSAYRTRLPMGLLQPIAYEARNQHILISKKIEEIPSQYMAWLCSRDEQVRLEMLAAMRVLGAKWSRNLEVTNQVLVEAGSLLNHPDSASKAWIIQVRDDLIKNCN